MLNETSHRETQRVAIFYGVDLDTAESFLRLPSEAQRALVQRYERWRTGVGLPARTSPLARGMFADMVRGDEVASPAWQRTAPDGASEVLRIVVFDDGALYHSDALGTESPYVVQITAGPSPGDDFVGVYCLDGEQLPLAGRTLSLAESVPTAVLDAVELEWEPYGCVLERI